MDVWEDLSIMNLFSVVENMTLETNSMTVSLLVNPIRNFKCRKKDLEQLELVRYSLYFDSKLQVRFLASIEITYGIFGRDIIKD